jgi:dipeptidyl aminopeptidase/acylaminoacyl peptidase
MPSLASVSPTPPDERVTSATAHWAPRFVANGSDYADFVSTLARIERWDQWCQEWGRTARAYEVLAAEAEQAGRAATAAGAWRRAALCWHWGKFVFMDDLDQQRAAHERTVACYAKAAPTLSPPAQRVEFAYGEFMLAGYLRVPAGPGPHPVVVMAPGLDSVKEELQPTADVLLARGLATLAIDGPGQGEAEYELNIEPAYEKAATAAVDFLVGRPEIDANRIGFFGVSMGGYYAGRAAAFEPRLRATVSLCGAYQFDLDWDTLPALTRAAFQQRSGAKSDDEARAIAATLSLDGVAQLITSPLLVIGGARDRLLPRHHAERLAAEAPGAELVMYEDGNHGITNHPFESRARMADWLADHLA